MVNIAFQNSLRSKDKDKFVASLREGGMVEDKSYLQETLSNVVPSGKKLLKETADMIMNPIDTAKSLYQLGSGVVQLAIPGEQGNEDIARAAGQYFADRYGSLEKAKESFKNDPVGVFTEAVGAVTGLAGASKLAVKGAGKALKTLPEIDTTAMASFPAMKFKTNNKGIIEELPNEKGKSIAELRKEYKLKESQRKPQNPELAELAKKLKNEEITSQQWKDAVNRINPVQVLTKVPEILSAKGIQAVLGKKTIGKIIGKDITLKVGQRVQSRIDIDAYDFFNKFVTTIHESGRGAPPAIGYGSGVYLTDITLNAPVPGAMKIAQGANKSSIARVEGNFKSYDINEISKIAKKEINNPNSEWSQVGYNPQRASYFYNRKTGLDEVLQSGDEMIQIGNLVLIKNAKFKPREEVLSATGIRGFNEGGIPTAATGVTKQSPEEIVVKGTKEDPFSYGNSLFSPSGIFGRGSGAIHPESPDSTFSPDTRGSAMMEDDEGYDEAYNYSQEAKENEEFNKKYDEYVISKNQSLEGKYSVANYVNTDIINKTVKETDVSKTDAYSILFGESSGGQFSHSSGIAKGGLQLTLNGFIGGKQHTKEYSYTPDRNTEKAKYDAFIENAKDDFSQLSDDDALYYSIQYMDKIKKDFPNKYGRDATLKDIAIIYTKGPGGATKFINDYSLLNKAENSLLNTYVNNVLETAENIEGVPELQEGGTPWGGATGTIYKEPSGPKPLQQQMINAFSEGGTPQNTELEEIIVTGQQDKADYPGALNNPSPILNPNYQTWENYKDIPGVMMDFARKPPEGFSEEEGTKTEVRGIDKSSKFLKGKDYTTPGDLRKDFAQRYNDDRFLDPNSIPYEELEKIHKDFLAKAALQEGTLPDLAKNLKTEQQLKDDTTLDYDEFKEYDLAKAKYGNEFEETMKEVEDNKFEKKPAGIILKKIKEILNTDTDQISDKTIDKYNSFMTLLKTDYPELYEDETIVLYGLRNKRNLPYTKDDIPTTIYPTYKPSYNYGANLEKIDDFNKLPKGMTSLKNLDSEFKTKISMIKEVPNLIYELNNGLDSVIENNLINITT